MAKQKIKITTKQQIPKSAQKRIPKFKELSNKEAIYGYEYYKLKRRVKAAYKKGYLYELGPLDYSKATDENIESIRNLTAEKLKTSKTREAYENLYETNIEGQYYDEYDEISAATKLIAEIRDFINDTIFANIKAYSVYRSGRSKNSKSVSFITDNYNSIERYLNSLINNAQTDIVDFVNSLNANNGEQLSRMYIALTSVLYDSLAAYQGINGVRDMPEFQTIIEILGGNPMSIDTGV